MENTTTINEQAVQTAPEISPEKKKSILLKKIKRNYSFASQAVLYQFLFMNIAQTVVLIPFIIYEIFKASGQVDQAALTEATQGYTLIATALAGVIADLLAIILVLKITKIGSPKNWIKKPEISPLFIVLGSFAILGTSNLNVTIMGFLGKFFQDTADALNSSLSLDPSKPVSFVFIALYVCLVGPILEEFLCRGVVLNLCSQVSVKFGIFMSALLFGVMHMNIIQGINAFVMGLVLAYVATKAKSIVPSIIMHIFNNSMAIISSLIIERLPESSQETASMIYTIGFIVIGIASLVILLVKNGKIKDGEKVPANASVRPGLLEELNITNKEATSKSFFTCIAFYIAIALFIGMSLMIVVLPSLMESLQNTGM